MADFLQHAITVQADQRPPVAIPRFTVEAVVKRDDGTQLDLTGANAVEFYLRVQNFSRADHRELVEKIAAFILRRIANLE